MLKKDSPIFLQNINMISGQLFLLFKKSTTFWDNPRTYEPRREKTGFLHILKQRRRSAELRGNREADQRLCFRYI